MSSRRSVRKSCIERGTNRYAVILKDYMDLFYGDVGLAAILYVFECATNRKMRALKASVDTSQPWVEAPVNLICYRLLGISTAEKVMANIEILERLGILSVQRPGIGMKNLYLLHTEVIAEMIRSGKKFNRNAELEALSLEKEGAAV